MALIKCLLCDAEISDQAKKCNKCGYDYPRGGASKQYQIIKCPDCGRKAKAVDCMSGCRNCGRPELIRCEEKGCTSTNVIFDDDGNFHCSTHRLWKCAMCEQKIQKRYLTEIERMEGEWGSAYRTKVSTYYCSKCYPLLQEQEKIKKQKEETELREWKEGQERKKIGCLISVLIFIIFVIFMCSRK